MKNKKQIGWLGGTIILILVATVLLICTYKPADSVTPRKEFEIMVDAIKADQISQATTQLTDGKNASQTSRPAVGKFSETSSVAKLKANDWVPSISADYRKYVGFCNYVATMPRIGTSFVIIDDYSRKIVAIDLKNKTLIKTDMEKIEIKNFSLRSGGITDEPKLECYLQLANADYGIIAPEVFMLVPFDFDLCISAAFQANNLQRNISTLKGFYCLAPNGRLLLKLKEAISDSKSQKINITISF
jgi:hypothetical protein